MAGVLYVAEYLLVRFSESLRAWMGEVLASGRALERAEGSARFGEELFRGIYGANAIGMMLTADDGAIVEANDHYLAMVGFSRPEVQAGLLSWKAITPPEWETANVRAVDELQASGSVTPFEKEYFRKDGSRVPVLMGSARIASRSLNLTYVINLTAQKRAERALRFLADASRVLAEHAQPMERRLAEVAALAAADLGRACRIDLLVAPQRHTRVAQAFRNPETEAALGAGGGLPDALVEEVADSGEVRTRPVSGAGLDPWSQMIGVPLRAHDRVLGAIVLVIDGAEQDGEVRAVAYELAGRIALAVEAERLFQQAQDAVRLRDEFLSIASHELRTPLTPLQLQLTMLKKRAGSIAVDEGAEKFLVGRLDLIQRQCDRLTRLIVDLLDISRLAEGRLQLQLEELDLGGVLDEVIEAFRGSGDLARSGSTIELSRAPVVGRWDRVRVEQLVTNLLSNALKYGAGKPVRLRLSVEGAYAVLEVKDEGIGIAPADQDRVFGRFERAVSARHYGGLGLGLYIVRQVVEAMGGTIELDSRVGEGARFVVRLPLAGPARGRAARRRAGGSCHRLADLPPGRPDDHLPRRSGWEGRWAWVDGRGSAVRSCSGAARPGLRVRRLPRRSTHRRRLLRPSLLRNDARRDSARAAEAHALRAHRRRDGLGPRGAAGRGLRALRQWARDDRAALLDAVASARGELRRRRPGVLKWTPGADQAATYALDLVEQTTGETGKVSIGVVENEQLANRVPIVDPAAYTFEYGLPVVHLSYPADPGLTSGAYRPAELVYRGHRYAIEAKYRGATSSSFPKRSLTLKFDEADLFDEPVFGGGFGKHKRVVLITSFNDNSYFRSRLAFDLWNRMAPEHAKLRTYSAVVYVNNRVLGPLHGRRSRRQAADGGGRDLEGRRALQGGRRERELLAPRPDGTAKDLARRGLREDRRRSAGELRAASRRSSAGSPTPTARPSATGSRRSSTSPTTRTGGSSIP